MERYPQAAQRLHGKTQLIQNGKAQPWSQSHKVFRDHLEQKQWADPQIPDHTAAQRKQLPPLFNSRPDQGNITMEELHESLRAAKKNKAPGPDEVPNEIYQLLDEEGRSRLLAIFNHSWNTGTTPHSWSEAMVVSIFKGKGDPANPSSYRPISLLNAAYKLYAAILQKRLASELEERLRTSQYGFRSHRGTAQPLFVIRRAMEWSHNTTTPLHFLFLDWKQAFDSLDHTAMIDAIRRLGTSEKMISNIAAIYSSPTFFTQGMHGNRASGKVGAGIHQGCPLSPYIFIAVLSVIFAEVDEGLLQQGTATNTWSVGHPVYDLEYADDTLLLGITSPQLQSILHTLETVAATYGLKLNQEKTELLANPKADHTALHFLDGTPVKKVHSAKYLGSMISWECTFEVALFHRLALAEEAYKKLRLVWNSTMSRTRKLKIFESTFVPILLYGLDALTLSQKQLYRVDSQYMRFLRRVMGIKASYYSRIPHSEVYKQANYPTLPSTTLQYTQYKTLVNIFALPRTNPVHGVIFGPAYKDRILLQGRRRGKPHPYWLNTCSYRFFPDCLPDHTAPANHKHSGFMKIARTVQSSSFELVPKSAFAQRSRP